MPKQEQREKIGQKADEKKGGRGSKIHGAIRNVTFILIVSSHSARVSTLPDSTPVIGVKGRSATGKRRRAQKRESWRAFVRFHLYYGIRATREGVSL